MCAAAGSPSGNGSGSGIGVTQSHKLIWNCCQKCEAVFVSFVIFCVLFLAAGADVAEKMDPKQQDQGQKPGGHDAQNEPLTIM